MEAVHYFRSIHVETPWTAIYRRLGYRERFAQLDERTRAMINATVNDGIDLLALQGAVCRVPISEQDNRRICLETGDCLISEKLARFLRDSDEVVLCAATGGSAIIDEIKGETGADSLTRAVVLDAAASEVVDAVLDWIVGYMTRMIRHENRMVTKGRFSAGYGDFALSYQETLYRLLGLDNIGVSITDNYILIPEKSVTAVAGIMTAEGT